MAKIETDEGVETDSFATRIRGHEADDTADEYFSCGSDDDGELNLKDTLRRGERRGSSGVQNMAQWAGKPGIKGSTESMRMALLTFSIIGLQYVYILTREGD